MSEIKEFFRTNAGKGTLCVLAACLLFMYPPALSLLASAAALGFGVRQFRTSFRKLDGQTAPRSGAVRVTARINDPAAGGSKVPVVVNVSSSATPAQPAVKERWNSVRNALVFLIVTPLIGSLGASALPAEQDKPSKAKKAVKAEEETFTPLFDGKSLTGWSDAIDNLSEWRVSKGVIEGRGGGKAQPAVLVTDRKDYRNFRLRIVYGFEKSGAGGIEIRRSDEPGSTSSYWVSACVSSFVQGKPRPPGHVTKLKDYKYGSEMPPPHDCEVAKAAVNHWHTLDIEAVGNVITTFINGVAVDSYTDLKHPRESGGIALFCRGESVIRIKEALIRELPDTAAPAQTTASVSF